MSFLIGLKVYSKLYGAPMSFWVIMSFVHYHCNASIYSYKDENAVSKDEFANMLISWYIDEATAEKLYDFITENGKKAMDCK